ncbi:peroxin 14/17 [Ophiocordyceps camponoti-floridani]|uniref:Peroxisomal membrane protein PEX14 n=1 Tax=Ophiocordyceps camponoti-floridani TaxID=2030778 RepID=A0A8H4Q710_9HYPO|nr:peroxin 14/17 [Ophiocordyceps camponoti-floridani]
MGDSEDSARRFLQDDLVRTASPEEKASFLKSKGVSDGDIQKLLAEFESQSRQIETAKPEPQSPANASNRPLASLPSEETETDRPPIVTYPEFLAKPVRPPPLVTTTRLLNTVYGFAGFATLLYGTSRYYLAPMVDDLTEARSDLYTTASSKLLALFPTLEKSVSVIPPAAGHSAPADDASDAEDPSEMFHRDVGTQTSLPDSPAGAAQVQPVAGSPSDRQADRLSDAVRTLSGLKDDFRSQCHHLEELRTLLDVLRDDLDGMTYGSRALFLGGYEMYGTKRSEPDDEIRKVRDNIRRVKGTLLSTRSFPSSTR